MTLTPRQTQTLQVIYNHWRTKGYAPSIVDVAQGLGGISTHAAWEKVCTLCRKGLLTKAPKVIRSVRLTAKGLTFVNLNART